MPQAYVEKLAKKHKVSIATAEKHWNAAKRAASKEGHKEDFAYVTGIFKKMMGESVQDIAREKVAKAVMLVQEAKVQKKLKALKASTFMEFLINEATDSVPGEPGIGDVIEFMHDGKKVEGKIARVGKDGDGKKFFTARITDGSLKGKVVSVGATKVL